MAAIAAVAIVGTVLAVVGAGVSTYAAVAQADAAKEAADYNAQVAKNNALTNQYQAQAQANRIRQRNLRVMASQQTAAAAAGIDVSSGSFQDVLYDSALQGELDAQTALYTGRVSAIDNLAKAKLFNAQGQYAEQAGAFNAAGSALSGLSSATGSVSSYYNNPRFYQNRA